MAKATGSYRQIVSIPADLKRRMDKVADEVNWSAVAPQAFEGKLGEIAAKKEKKNMQDVIQRLRGLKSQEANETFLEGYALGEKWAKESATPNEMQRLQDNWPLTLCDTFEGEPSAPNTFADVTYFILHPECDGDRAESSSFWKEKGIRKDQQCDSTFVAGWVNGVSEIWNAVKDEI
jgi:hypothetical protein